MIASDVKNSRPLRAKVIFSESFTTDLLAEVLEIVKYSLWSWLGHFAGDFSVFEKHDDVGVARCYGIMSYHDDGLTKLGHGLSHKI